MLCTDDTILYSTNEDLYHACAQSQGALKKIVQLVQYKQAEY